MSEHVAYMGLTVDHLYPDCPALVRSIPHHDWPIGTECRGTVDPEGTDLCGWCQARWRRTTQKSAQHPPMKGMDA